ncbi:conjugal transfer protein, partial [Microbacterium pseudoresistens]
EVPFEYRNLAVAAVGPKSDSGLIQVQVAAEVKESHLDKDKKPVSSWPQRYFQVAIVVDGTQISPVGMPRAIASPMTASTKAYGFNQNVPASDPLAQSISSFLQAYAAGVGDITRYTAPTANIVAIAPAPYAAVKAQDFKATTEPVATPADGATILTLTRVLLVTASGQQVAADYTLVLKARAGRWEVSEINPDITTKPTTKPTTNAVPPTGK